MPNAFRQPPPAARPGAANVMSRSIFLPLLAGCLLHSYTFAFKAGADWSPFVLGLLALSLSPYAVAALLARRRSLRHGAFGFATASLVGDLFMHYSVFIAPKGSTAALGLLFMPGGNLLLLGPSGALVCWAIARAGRSKAGTDTP